MTVHVFQVLRSWAVRDRPYRLFNMFCRNSRRECGLQNFTERRHIIFRDPAAQLEDLWSQQRRTIDDARHRMNFDIRRFIASADDKTFNVAFSERNENTRAGLQSLV